MKFSKIVREKFLSEIRARDLLSNEDGILVAFSGGPDSACLLHLMTSIRKKFSLRLAAAYIDHRLRPAETKKEIAFAVKTAREYGLPLFITRLKIKETGMGPEAAARKYRYLALMSIAAEKGYGKIATAHTLNDQAETVLLNIIRSSGIDGIIGIPPARKMKDSRTGRTVTVIRPMLGISKKEVLGYLRENRLQSVTDSSNYDTRFTRNLIRARVMPMLEKINPAVLTHLSAIASWSDEARKRLDADTGKLLRRIARKGRKSLYLDLPSFLKYNYSVKLRIIRCVLKYFNQSPSLKQNQNLIKFASERTKRRRTMKIGDSLYLTRKGGTLAFRR